MTKRAALDEVVVCARFLDAKGLCVREVGAAHYSSWRRWGDPLTARRHGPKGGGHLNRNGYRYITVNGRRVLEHRHVMEQKLGRKLLPGETVHHKGAKHDNRPHKLELRVSAHGPGVTVPEALAWAHEILDRYDHLALAQAVC